MAAESSVDDLSEGVAGLDLGSPSLFGGPENDRCPMKIRLTIPKEADCHCSVTISGYHCHSTISTEPPDEGSLQYSHYSSPEYMSIPLHPVIKGAAARMKISGKDPGRIADILWMTTLQMQDGFVENSADAMFARETVEDIRQSVNNGMKSSFQSGYTLFCSRKRGCPVVPQRFGQFRGRITREEVDNLKRPVFYGPIGAYKRGYSSDEAIKQGYRLVE